MIASTEWAGRIEVHGMDGGEGERTGDNGGSDARAKRRSGIERDEHVIDCATATLARGKVDLLNFAAFCLALPPLPRQLDRDDDRRLTGALSASHDTIEHFPCLLHLMILGTFKSNLQASLRADSPTASCRPSFSKPSISMQFSP